MTFVEPNSTNITMCFQICYFLYFFVNFDIFWKQIFIVFLINFSLPFFLVSHLFFNNFLFFCFGHPSTSIKVWYVLEYLVNYLPVGKPPIFLLYFLLLSSFPLILFFLIYPLQLLEGFKCQFQILWRWLRAGRIWTFPRCLFFLLNFLYLFWPI